MYIEEDKKIYGLSRYGKSISAFAGIAAGFILSRIFLLMPFIVQDDSMKPGLGKGDYVLILKMTSPKAGDILLLKSPVEPDRVIFKRMIAKGEKSVTIKDKKIFIDGKKFNPGWEILSNDSRVFPEYFSTRDNLELKMHKGEIFVIGDNFDYSFDSRSFGAIDEKLIIGRMIFKF